MRGQIRTHTRIALVALALVFGGCDGSGPDDATFLTGFTRVAGVDSTLADVLISVAGQTVTSGVDGAFRIDGLDPGKLVVTASLQGFEPYVREIAVMPGRHRLDPALVRIRPAQPPPPPPRTGVVEGTVRSRPGAPLAGVTVTLAGRVAITDDDGAYRMDLVPTGDAWGTFTMPGFQTASVKMMVDTLTSRLDVDLPVRPYAAGVRVSGQPLYSAPGLVDGARVQWAAPDVPSSAYPSLALYTSVDNGTFEHVITLDGAATAGPWTPEPVSNSQALRFAVQVIDCEGGRSALFESEPVATYDLGLVRIAAGSFMMGSDTAQSELERPAHAVTLTRGFYLARAETDVNTFRRVAGGTPLATRTLEAVQGAGAWQTVEFLNLLSDAEGLERCYDESNHPVERFQECTGYRLPTEAEWEYAARAGSTTLYPWGDDPGITSHYAWTRGIGATRMHPTMLLSANAWGLFDMIGNAAELVQDQEAPFGPEALVDPFVYDRTKADPFDWVVRGGSFWETAGRDQYTSTYRSASYPSVYVGFRVARTVPPGE